MVGRAGIVVSTSMARAENAGREVGADGSLGNGPVVSGPCGTRYFYGLLASLRGRLFRVADFAEFYYADNGRDSVPPSLLATALPLQTNEKVSDAEAKARPTSTSAGRWLRGI